MGGGMTQPQLALGALTVERVPVRGTFISPGVLLSKDRPQLTGVSETPIRNPKRR